MSRDFNLFLLHRTSDVHPRSWVCVSGNVLINIVSRLEKEILTAHKISREHLSKLLSGELHCARGVIKRLLQGKAPFYPIVVLQKLLERSPQPKVFYNKIQENISTLKVNSSSAKVVNAVYNLSGDLAKIIGAFAADGSLSVQLILSAPAQQSMEKLRTDLKRVIQSPKVRWSPARKQYYIAIQLNEHSRNLLTHLEDRAYQDLLTQTHYVIELTDEYEDNVRAFARWMKTVFDIDPTSLGIKRKKRAWRVIFSNKIVARYLTEFFGMKSGSKTYTVGEPEVIKNSKLHIRKNFARGALMFDGCVTKGGRIMFSTKSRNFTIAMQEIWTKDKIAHGSLSRNNRGEYTIGTIIPNITWRLLKYFEPETQKWKLLRWISGDEKAKPIIKEIWGISAHKILKLLKKIKSCDVNFLENHFKRRYTTIYHFLRILNRQKKVRVSNRPHFWSASISEQTTVRLEGRVHNVVFNHIKKRFGYYKNATNVLDIHKATFSAWKVRKNRIPIGTLRHICSLLDIDFQTIARAIIKTDRNIVELI